jgi:hypothetical protein
VLINQPTALDGLDFPSKDRGLETPPPFESSGTHNPNDVAEILGQFCPDSYCQVAGATIQTFHFSLLFSHFCDMHGLASWI